MFTVVGTGYDGFRIHAKIDYSIVRAMIAIFADHAKVMRIVVWDVHSNDSAGPVYSSVYVDQTWRIDCDDLPQV